MKKTFLKRVNLDLLNLQEFPVEIVSFIEGADLYDSSCSKEARVYFLDKDEGYYLKIAEAGDLNSESLMYRYFYGLDLSSELVLYRSVNDKDYLVTKKVSGETCVHERYINDIKRLTEVLAISLY